MNEDPHNRIKNLDTYRIYRTAKVVSTNDPLRIGRIKVRILPELENAEEKNLPWAVPEISGMVSSKTMSCHVVPPVGSLIRVVIEDEYFRNIRWVGNDFVPNHEAYNFIHEIYPEELLPQEYPNPQILRYPDGTIMFHNLETGEIGIQKPDSCYILIDHEKNIVISNDKIKIKISNDSVIIDAPKIVMKGLEKEEIFEKIKTALSSAEEKTVSSIQVSTNDKTEEILGNSVTLVGGCDQKTISGDKAETILSKSTSMVVGEREEQAGGDYNIQVLDPTKKLKIESIGPVPSKIEISQSNLTATCGPNSVSIDAVTGITLTGAGTIAWKPNIIPNCLFTGAPHGGIPGLKGG